MKDVLLIYVLFSFNLVFGQDSCVVISPRFIYDCGNKYYISREDSRIGRLVLYRKNKVSIHENDFEKLQQDSIISSYARLISKQGISCIFVDSKNRRIETGCWHVEYFSGLYKNFYKDGSIRSIGIYSSVGDRVGVWSLYKRRSNKILKNWYYDEVGNLIRVERKFYPASLDL
jgi:hypothetical protein